MSKTFGPGTSDVTDRKMRDFRALIRTQIKIVENLLNKFSWADQKYFYCDLNSGPGIYDTGYIGSPMIFIEEIEATGLDYEAILIEKDKETFEKINDLLHTNKKVSIFNGSSDDEAMRLEYSKSKPVFGLFYMDFNGEPDFELMKKISFWSKFNRADFLINSNCTIIKRCLKAFDNRKRLSEHLCGINKKHWMIREPVGTWQWSMLLGTQWRDFPSFKKYGFHWETSRKGEMIFKKINYTEKELKKHDLHHIVKGSKQQLELF